MTAADFSAQQPTILLISPPVADADLVSDRARTAGWRTIVISELSQAIDSLKLSAGVSAVVLDDNASSRTTSDAVAELKMRNPTVPVVVITDNTSPQWPIQIIRAGASDFLRRPIEPDRLLRALRTVTTGALARELKLAPFAEKFEAKASFESLVGQDGAFRRTVAKAAAVGRCGSHVLIEGESGTGKNTLARAIHSVSPRSKKQLKYLLLRGMNERRLESCLFGHERNAFVGAFESSEGVVQQHPGGTLVLDQIDRLPLSIQERLADCLCTGSVRPIGATHSAEIDVRIVSLSNRPLRDLIAGGGFSSRLYELLSKDELVLPPLRDRGDDVSRIAREFLKKIHEDNGSEAYITDEALDLLCCFNWPQNIPQLQAVLIRAAAFSRSNGLTAEDFPDVRRLMPRREEIAHTRTHHSPGSGMPWVFREDGHVRSLEEVEAYVIKLAIEHYGGRISEVARRLQLGRSTLYRKLALLGIDGEKPERSRRVRASRA